MLTFQHLKRYTAIFCFAGVVSMPSLAGVHVDVNIGVGSPGYYGVLPIQGVTPSLWNANPDRRNRSCARRRSDLPNGS